MSFKTYVNNTQIFGNNEGYEKWDNFIREEGIEIDKDGCYSGEIIHVNKAIKVLEEIVLDIDKERLDRRKPWLGKVIYDDIAYLMPKSIFDFTDIPDTIGKVDCDGEPYYFLTDSLMDLYENAYMFLPVIFVKAIETSCKRCFATSEDDQTDAYRFFKYKIKEGKHIKVKCS